MSSSIEKSIMLSLLELYKDMPHLWNKDHEDYMKKNVRNEGFRVLLEIYKTIDEKATVKSLKKKIENLRTTYDREFKKVSASKQSGAVGNQVYVPSLWYYNAMSFLGDRKASCCSLPDPLGNETFPWGDDENASMAASCSDQSIVKEETLTEEQGHLETTKMHLETKDEQWEVYARSIAFQLKDINEHQLVICQKLISDAIFSAKLNRLNENSQIVTPKIEPAFH